MFNKIVPKGGGLTVLELVEKYVSLKIGVRQSTYAGYKTIINLLKKDDFGKMHREIFKKQSIHNNLKKNREKWLNISNYRNPQFLACRFPMADMPLGRI